jgi:DNA polymerase-3 subunit alpha
MAGFTWAEVDKLRKAISKKSGRDFDDACNLFRTKSLDKGVSEEIVNEVLALMAKFGGYAFNRSHACSYALLSYYTAYLRYYYPSEWLAACIQIDRLDEDRMAILLNECRIDRIPVKDPNINESGVETTVNKRGEIFLPLSTIKGVGARAEDIVEKQPYTDLKDFCYRVRPNRGMVEALSKTTALDCLEGLDVEESEFMTLWDELVETRTKEERNAAKLAKFRDKNSVSVDDIINKRRVIRTRSKAIDTLLDDNLFD